MNILYKDTVKLFGSILVSSKNKFKEPSDRLLNETIRRGFIFDPVIVANFLEDELIGASKDIGLSPEQLNAGFHKSFSVVFETQTDKLVIQQLIHYFTTYGVEYFMGRIENDLVYIPKEELQIPSIKKDIPLRVIKAITTKELEDKVLNLLSSGVALSEDVLTSIRNILPFISIEKNIDKIKNNEAKILLYEITGTIPKDPVDFLRYVVYKKTNSTLLIKNNELFLELSSQSDIPTAPLFKQYESRYGLEKLASIFFRFKPIFLALRKSEPILRKIINRIRKLADKYHKPLPLDMLSSLTIMIRKNTLDLDKLKSKIETVNVFRKIRLANSLLFYLNQKDVPIAFRIRNGKLFVKPKYKMIDNQSLLNEAYTIVYESILDHFRKYENKTFLLNSNIVYSLPTSEKNFLGNLPSGTIITPEEEKALVVGVYWENVNRKQTDLDLSFVSVNEKIGWDGGYKNINIAFSGDLTNADPYAVEAIYAEDLNSTYLVQLNFYNHYNVYQDCPFKFIVSQRTKTKAKEEEIRDFLIDPNSVILQTSSTIGPREIILGFLYKDETIHFVVKPLVFRNRMVSRLGPYTFDFFKYLDASLNTNLLLNNVLLDVHARTVFDEISKYDYDLRIDKIDKTSLIKLCTGDL